MSDEAELIEQSSFRAKSSSTKGKRPPMKMLTLELEEDFTAPENPISQIQSKLGRVQESNLSATSSFLGLDNSIYSALRHDGASANSSILSASSAMDNKDFTYNLDESQLNLDDVDISVPEVCPETKKVDDYLQKIVD